MARAFVLMKAMPPTTGHLQLIRFAQELSSGVTVIVDTAEGEPMVAERLEALRAALLPDGRGTPVKHILNEVEDPETPGFWEFWRGVLVGAGFLPGDLIVGSEAYCKRLAEVAGGRWMPYDPLRGINFARATSVRDHPYIYWGHILPEFRKHLQVRVTIYGAESCGKTTLANKLKWHHYTEEQELRGNHYSDLDELTQFPQATVLPEWARPYLEQVKNVITTETMTDIWEGQHALQNMDFLDTPLVIQDTDLYSTYGYWSYWSTNVDWDLAQRIGVSPAYAATRLDASPPLALRESAKRLKSDLYIMLPSVIPFEPDPLRYGGDRREIDDAYWRNLASWEGLNVKVLSSDSPHEWLAETVALIKAELAKKAELIKYQRPGQ